MGQDTIDPAPKEAREAPAPPAPRGGRRGRATRRRDPATPCLNCGDETPGRYCPTCGQHKTDVQVSLRTLVLDALEDELSLDRRLPATLGALFLEPGQLTVDYVNGRVARYIRPVRLYLVSSIVFFVVLSFLSVQFLRESLGDFGPGTPPSVENVTLPEVDSALAGVRAAMRDDMPAAAVTALRVTETQLLRQRAALVAAAAAEDGDEDEDGIEAAGEDVGAADDGSVAAWAAERDVMSFLDGFEPNLGHPALSAAAATKIRQLRRMEPREAAERVAADFLRYAPTVMFVLLPFFGVMLKLLYIRRRRYYAEHFIFLLHTQSFVFLQFTVLLLLVGLGWTVGWLIFGILAWILLYTYLAMKRVYGQGWLKTLVKWWTLGWAYFWILAFTVPLAFLATTLLA